MGKTENKLPHLQSPCNQCPMTKDCAKGWLGEDRIIEVLAADSFTCHKDSKKQCAGHMHLLGTENMYVRQAGRLGIDLGLKSKDRVFKTKEGCIEHHSD